MKTEIVTYKQLRPAEQEGAPNNGAGREWASYLVVEHSGMRRVYSSAMEPEDVSFYRDLQWVPLALGEAYEAGATEAVSEIDGVAGEAQRELTSAQKKHGPMRGAHEGYAVILEELDELWDEIKAQQPDKAAMRKEALQVAAMALRFIEDVCDR